MYKVEEDFEELLRLLNKHRVRYCIVGAFAVGYHAIPRYTKDLDILVEPTTENANRILEALCEFGFGSLDLGADDLSKEGRVVQLGFEPVRVGLITSIKGGKFGKLWERREKGKLGGVSVNFISLSDLIKNKSVTGRKKDEPDVDILKQAESRQKNKRRTKRRKR